MSPLFHTDTLADHQFALALPLIQVTWPEIDLPAWLAFAHGIQQEGGGLLALKEPDDYICGLLAYRRQTGLTGKVLSVPLFTVADLANRWTLAEALVEALEHLARQLGCRVGHLEFHWRQSRLLDSLRRLGWPAEAALLQRRWE